MKPLVSSGMRMVRKGPRHPPRLVPALPFTALPIRRRLTTEVNQNPGSNQPRYEIIPPSPPASSSRPPRAPSSQTISASASTSDAPSAYPDEPEAGPSNSPAALSQENEADPSNSARIDSESSLPPISDALQAGTSNSTSIATSLPSPPELVFPPRTSQHPFDTHAFFSYLEKAKVKPGVSKSLMEAVKEMILQRGDWTRREMVGKEDMENVSFTLVWLAEVRPRICFELLYPNFGPS